MQTEGTEGNYINVLSYLISREQIKKSEEDLVIDSLSKTKYYGYSEHNGQA